MLFFVKEIKKEDTCAHKKNKTDSKTAPLQVRNSCSRFLSAERNFRKRALSLASLASRTSRASLSLEAAMCLSLFLFLSVCLIMPIKMMDRQRQIQAVMESVGEEMSRFAYVEYCFKQIGEDEVDTGRAQYGTETLQEADEDGTVLALKTAYGAARILAQIDKDWIENVSFQGTDIGTNNMVYIEMRYRMRFPFSVLGLNGINVKQVCSRRMWTGAEGGRHREGQGGAGKQEETVYIGKNSTRYHRQRTCHYLYNNLEEAPAGTVDQMRNRSGARYTSCRRCGGGADSGTVYIMPYGTSYHTQRSCSTIIAYVQEVPFSSAVHLGVCSYCGGE